MSRSGKQQRTTAAQDPGPEGLVEEIEITNEDGMPVVLQRVRFAAPYEKFWAKVRVNPTYRTKTDLGSGERARFLSAFKKIAVAWNFLDEDGNPIPPGEPEDVPDELLQALIAGWSLAVAEYSKLPKVSSGRSRTT